MKRVECRRPSDECLVRRCKQQLPYVTDAYEELFQRYQAVVLRTCHRYLGNPEEAQEACQDIFLRVFTKISQFEGRSSFRTWLYRVVFNTCSTRRQRLWKESRFALTAAKNLQEGVSAKPEEGGGLVEAVLDQLLVADKEILLLRFEAELSLEEIAQFNGSKLSAAKMRLYRAMERFKALYTDVEKWNAT
jgi:RNA polymerase sigma-70 factor (ECF subfamily)